MRGRQGILAVVVLAVVTSVAGGCGRPYAANIQLRKENQALREEVKQLRAMRQADIANRFMAVGETGGGVSLDRLFTAHGLRVGRLTGIYGQRLRVFVVPTDQEGDLLKAAGSFELRAFDLNRGREAMVGAWQFTEEEAAAAWNGELLQYGYVLECALPRAMSEGESLTVRIVFTDLLTGRRIEADTVARVRPVPSERVLPSTRTAETGGAASDGR